MSENNYELHFKDRWNEIHLKAPSPEWIKEWWEKIEKKLESQWGLGPKTPKKEEE